MSALEMTRDQVQVITDTLEVEVKGRNTQTAYRLKHLPIDPNWYIESHSLYPHIIVQTRQKMDGAIPIADAQSVGSSPLKTALTEQLN
jgi:hypothetical protein